MSSDDQAHRQTPIRTQLDICRRTVDQHFGDDVSLREFVDEGLSGQLGLRKTPEQRSGFRPELTALCEAIASGQIDAVVVEDGDRLARNEFVMLELITDFFQRHSIRVFDGRGEVDLQSPEGLLTRNILSAVAAFYPRQTARKVKAGLARRAREGYPMTKTVYGWRWQDPDEIPPGARRGLERVEAQGVWVRRMKDRYLAGWGSAKIVRELNERGVPSPSGRTWNVGSVLKALDNPLHAGLVRLPEGEGYVEGHHYTNRYFEPEEFYEIQRIRDRKRRKRGKYDTSRFIVTGTAVCGECGRGLVGATHPTARYYHCNPKDDYDRRPCRGLTIRADHLEHAVVQRIEELAGSEDMQRILAEELESLVAEQESKISEELKAHEAALDEIKRTRDRIFAMLRKDHISDEEYATRGEQLNNDQAGLQKAISQTQALLDNKRLHQWHIDQVRQTLASFQDTWETLTHDERRRVVELVMEHVTVRHHEQGKEIVIKPSFLPESRVIVPAGSRPHRPRFGLEALTRRQLAALALFDQGLRPKDIAGRWQTSVANVRTQLNSCRNRLQVGTNEEAVERARPLIAKFYDYLPLDGRDGVQKTDIKFSDRQRDILKLMARPKLRYADIAKKLDLSLSTVKWHIHQIMGKFGVTCREEAVAQARKLGFLKENDLPPIGQGASLE